LNNIPSVPSKDKCPILFSSGDCIVVIECYLRCVRYLPNIFIIFAFISGNPTSYGLTATEISDVVVILSACVSSAIIPEVSYVELIDRTSLEQDTDSIRTIMKI
jgi:hypothetical protein